MNGFSSLASKRRKAFLFCAAKISNDFKTIEEFIRRVGKFTKGNKLIIVIIFRIY